LKWQTQDDKSNIFILLYKYLQLGTVKAQPDSATCTEGNSVSHAPLFDLLWQHQEGRALSGNFPAAKKTHLP